MVLSISLITILVYCMLWRRTSLQDAISRKHAMCEYVHDINVDHVICLVCQNPKFRFDEDVHHPWYHESMTPYGWVFLISNFSLQASRCGEIPGNALGAPNGAGYITWYMGPKKPPASFQRFQIFLGNWKMRVHTLTIETDHQWDW